jgi:hypothetical protein
MHSHDRDTVIRLRHALQTCESTQRHTFRALDAFRAHLMAVGQQVPIQQMAELLGELATIRAQLAGTGKGGAA